MPHKGTVHVLCLKETRGKGPKERKIRKGVKVCYNRKDINRNGVGKAVAESFKDSVAADQGIGNCIMPLNT